MIFALTLLQAAGGNSWMSIGMIVLLFIIMYFFMIRPQQKRQKELQNFQNSLQVGQEVVTTGGIHGKISSIDEATGIISLEVAMGVKIKIDRAAILQKA
ncbi:MAG: preprotein translocase subunit YajC [Bacteroidales bacterium]|nr:preprotein translocase subunit YajC [Bacteroidales bacterium]